MTKKLEMTEELRAKLQGYLPMKEDATVTFTPQSFDLLDLEDDIIKAIAPVITIRAWSNKEILKVKEQQLQDSIRQTKFKETGEIEAVDQKKILLDLIKDTIVNIDNFKDSELNDIKFNKTNLKYLQEFVVIDIFDKLSDISGLTKTTMSQLKKKLKIMEEYKDKK
jgi:hypothetical protein